MAATPEAVWRLLMDPASYGTWADAPIVSVEPPGRAHPGQVVVFGSGFLGLRLTVTFDVERVDETSKDLELEGRFPFGMTMHEHITVRPVDGQSRIQFG